MSHVSFIAPTTYAEVKFSRPTQVCALSATRGRRGRRTSFAVKSRVSSSQPRHQSCFAPRQNTAGIRHRTRVRSLPRRLVYRNSFAPREHAHSLSERDFTPTPAHVTREARNLNHAGNSVRSKASRQGVFRHSRFVLPKRGCRQAVSAEIRSGRLEVRAFPMSALSATIWTPQIFQKVAKCWHLVPLVRGPAVRACLRPDK